MSVNTTTTKDTHRDEQRRARKMAKEQGISYQAALQTVRSLHKNAPVVSAEKPKSGLEDNELSYRAALEALSAEVGAWVTSCQEEDEGDGALLDKAYRMAGQTLDDIRNDGHKYRVKLDMVEVTRNALKRFAKAVDDHEELVMVYESTINHSVYEADEELMGELRSARRFLSEADNPEFRARYTHTDNPLRQLEVEPVPVPDPDGETVDGIRQGTRLRSTSNPNEIRVLLTGPYKDHMGMIARLSDPRDGVTPEPGDNCSWGGHVVLASQLRMLFEPLPENE